MQTRPFTVLLVEDDVQQADSFSRLFNKVAPDVKVEVCACLSAGLAASDKCSPNVTIIDLGIPMFPGEPVLQYQLVADYFHRFRPPIIVMTGQDDPTGEIETECMKKGATRFFSKPKAAGLIAWLAQSKEQFAASLLSAAGAADLRARYGNGHR